VFGSSVRGQRQAASDDRNFDARLSMPGAPARDAAPRPGHAQAIAMLRQSLPWLAVTLDERTGATRTLSNQAGYLSAADGRAPLDIAESFLRSNIDALGLEPSDLAEYEVTDITPNRTTGSTHVYLRQTFGGVPVYNAQLQVNINRDGRITSVGNQFVRGLAAAVRASGPAVPAARAVANAAAHLGTALRQPARVTGAAGDVVQTTMLAAGDVSLAPVRAALMYLPIEAGTVRLVWNFQIQTLDGEHAYDFTVDAGSGQVWTRFDWSAGDSYRVYPARPQPVESPSHGTPLPPGDARLLVTGASDLMASPYGWHDWNGAADAEFETMRGNNVHAYEDRANLNYPPAAEPSCGAGLLCDFTLDLMADPIAYVPASVANLFYWNNVLHDVQYRYGFTEAAGNFQFNNYGRGGYGDDEVQAEAQDGGDVYGRVNNASFTTPPDGYRPRMQMFTWTMTSPRRDASLDAGVIVHEYGHGISNRLVGGPSNVSCLANRQQPGEGISDWLALVYTAKSSDTAAVGRGIATYLMGQAPTGPGIRFQRYSTDPAVNTWTYASIATMGIPHGVGSVWAQAAWEMYWALVGAHGFDANLYDATGPAGNQRALLYMTEGLMNTPCSPTFTDLRDGILLAALDNHGGSDYCRLWRSFAGFGLGADAVSSGPDGTSPVEGFGVPGVCAPAGAPTITINNVVVSEAAGVASFTAYLSAPTSVPVTVQYTTSDLTAVSSQSSADYDYEARSGSVVIPAGAFAQSIDIPIRNDAIPEPREHFSVTIVSSINAPIGAAEGIGIIDDEDQQAAPPPNPYSEVVFDLGALGVWMRANALGPTPGWAQLHGYNPLHMATGDIDGNGRADLVLNFPGMGLWVWANGTNWMQAHPFNPSEVVLGDLDGNGLDEIIADFYGFGVYALYNSGTVWQRIFYLNAAGLAVGNLDNDPGHRDELLINFPGAGLWAWTNNSYWVAVHPSNVSSMQTGDIDGNGQDDLLANFTGAGLWARMNNGESWVHVHPLNSISIAVANIDGDSAGQADIIVNFPGIGLWALMNRTTWVRIHGQSVTRLATADLDANGVFEVIGNFPGGGVWVLANFREWVLLTPNAAEEFAAGRIDDR
jgi:extracellular elastinolytic metalloproteinase